MPDNENTENNNPLQPILVPKEPVITVLRPNLDRPDVYRIDEVSETALMDIEVGLLLEIEKYKTSIRRHDNCDPELDNGCQVSSDPRREPPVWVDCSEDLMFLYGRVAELQKLVFSMKFLRNQPSHKSAL